MSRRTGRPPAENPRRNAIHARFADDELTEVRAAASKSGLTVGEWARTKLLAAARRANRKQD